MITILMLFIFISWKMTLFLIGTMAPTLCFTPIYGRYAKRIRKEISDAKANASNVAEEAIANIRTVKAFATEEVECNDYAEKNDFVFKKAKEQAFWYGGF
jgi:ABC-type multidrug transport system fused ATPase/permease subunit